MHASDERNELEGTCVRLDHHQLHHPSEEQVARGTMPGDSLPLFEIKMRWSCFPPHVFLILCLLAYSGVSRNVGKTYDMEYKILGLKNPSTFAEIKSAYRRLAIKFHPDKNHKNPAEAQDRFVRVSAAYRKLTTAADDGIPAEEDRGDTPEEEEMGDMDPLALFSEMFSGLGSEELFGSSSINEVFGAPSVGSNSALDAKKSFTGVDRPGMLSGLASVFEKTYPKSSDGANDGMPTLRGMEGIFGEKLNRHTEEARESKRRKRQKFLAAPVAVLGEKRWPSKKSRFTWLIQFNRQGDRVDKGFMEEWGKLAKRLQGFLKVGSVDCAIEYSLCHKKLEVKTFPTYILFQRGRLTFYEGEDSIPDIQEFALAKLGGRINSVASTAELQVFVKMTCPRRASWGWCIVLITKQKTSSALYRALSEQFAGKLAFAHVYTNDAAKFFMGGSMGASMGLNQRQQRARKKEAKKNGPYGGAPKGTEGTGYDLYDIRTGGQVQGQQGMNFPLPSLLAMAPAGRLDMPQQYRGTINAVDLSGWLEEFQFKMPDGRSTREPKNQVPKLEGFSRDEYDPPVTRDKVTKDPSRTSCAESSNDQRGNICTDNVETKPRITTANSDGVEVDLADEEF